MSWSWRVRMDSPPRWWRWVTMQRAGWGHFTCAIMYRLVLLSLQVRLCPSGMLIIKITYLADSICWAALCSRCQWRPFIRESAWKDGVISNEFTDLEITPPKLKALGRDKKKKHHKHTHDQSKFCHGWTTLIADLLDLVFLIPELLLFAGCPINPERPHYLS